MHTYNTLIISFLGILLFSCGNGKKTNTPQFKINASAKKATYHLGEKLNLTITANGKEPIDSVSYTFQDTKLSYKGNEALQLPLSTHLLGKHLVTATVHSNGEKEKLKIEVTILNNTPPKIYGYKIVNTYPHNTKHYTQGLEFSGDNLYESAGHKKESKLVQIDLVSGKTLKEHNLNDRYFAEGLTIVGNKIHQLTWKGNIGFTYDLETFKEISTFAYNKSREGWGLCNDGNKIYKSDGSTKIWKLNIETLAEEDFIQIATNTSINKKINELEWVEGKIYANTWQKDGIAIINPLNGAIEGIINLKGLRKEVGVSESDDNRVLNGIAYKKDTKQLFVTGKYWNKIFEIVLVE